MFYKLTKIIIQCPSCKNKGHIDVSEEQLRNVKRGLLAINIPQGNVCEHTFITYLDKNLVIRDYFIADYQFQVVLPEIEALEEKKDVIIPEQYLTNLNLVKLNVSANLMAYLLKSIFIKKKILLLSEDSFLNNIILNFFEYLTQDTFDIDITFLSDEQYKQESKKYKEYMVFDGTKIIRNVNKSINLKKLTIEKQIVQKFISEIDLNSSLLYLKNDIQKVYFLAKSIVDIINNQYKNEKINILKINKNLEESHNTKINNLYLEFLVEIVKNYFGINVPSIFESFHDLL